MACGLGAIILVFMMVKFNTDTSVPETERLRADLERLAATEQSLREAVSSTQDRTGDTAEEVRAVSTRLAAAETKLADLDREIARKTRKLAALKTAIESAPPAETSDVVEVTGEGEENYILGLNVEGRHIGILVDASASMTEERLVDVIRRKSSPDAVKRAGPKWQRTKRVVRWLVARLPADARVSVIAFNDKTYRLGDGPGLAARDAQALGTIFRDLDALTPTGATNLQNGLQAMAKDAPTNVYLITDGLPTTGQSGYKSLNPFASCSALWGQSSTISGECRLKLFEHTVKAQDLPARVPVNVVLLPIEGDPKAAPAFWAWASTTGGLLISPAAQWP